MSNAHIDLEDRHCTHSYHPLPVALVRGDGPRQPRGRGLVIGVETALARAREVCGRRSRRGLLSKETAETVVRLAPPLAIDHERVAGSVKQNCGVPAERAALRKAS